MAATPWSIQKDRDKDLDTLPYIAMYGELRKGFRAVSRPTRCLASTTLLGCLSMRKAPDSLAEWTIKGLYSHLSYEHDASALYRSYNTGQGVPGPV
jgi:hypothetical protein